MTDIHFTAFWGVTSYTLVDTSVSVKSSTSIFRVEPYLILWMLGQQFPSKRSYLPAKHHGVTRQDTTLLPDDGSNSLLRNVVYIGYHIPECSNLHKHSHENMTVSQSVKELSVLMRHWFHHWSASRTNAIKFISSEFVSIWCIVWQKRLLRFAFSSSYRNKLCPSMFAVIAVAICGKGRALWNSTLHRVIHLKSLRNRKYCIFYFTEHEIQKSAHTICWKCPCSEHTASLFERS